jgi:hypothetical protein
MARAMDDIVMRSIAKWPDVPDVYGWLALDRRGNWLIRSTSTTPSSTSATPSFEKIGNRALREFIARNYQADARGCWYFQNGPQRVFVSLAYTPLVLHFEGAALVDHCGRPFPPGQAYLDEEGSVLLQGAGAIGLLDDRDLARFADAPGDLQAVARRGVAERFGYVANPAP